MVIIPIMICRVCLRLGTLYPTNTVQYGMLTISTLYNCTTKVQLQLLGSLIPSWPWRSPGLIASK